MTTKEYLYNQLLTGQMSRDSLRGCCKLTLGRDVSTTDRKLRELTNEGKIEPIIKKGFIVAYKVVEVKNPAIKKTHTSPVADSSTVEPIYITKQRERALEEENKGIRKLNI